MSVINTRVVLAEHCHKTGGETKQLHPSYNPYFMMLFSKCLVLLYPKGAQLWFILSWNLKFSDEDKETALSCPTHYSSYDRL